MKNLAFVCLLLFSVACGSRSGKNATGADSVQAASDSAALGPVIERTYEGVLPAADCPGIRYHLTLESREHSGDGTYRLAMTYIEAGHGRDTTYYSDGRWGTLRGAADDPDATIYQLDIGDSVGATNFLSYSDSLILVGPDGRRAESELNYTLLLVDTREVAK